MPISLASIKWDKIFRGEILEWPELLTKTYWDKKKGKVITATKSTGIGAALKKCEDSFKATKVGEYVVGGRNVDEVDKFANANLVPFINGSAMKNLHDDLKDLRDLAISTEKDLKKMPLIPTSTRKLVKEISEAADMLMIFCNKNSLSGYLERAVNDEKDRLNSVQRGRAGFSTQQAVGMGKKALGAIADIRKKLGTGPLNPETVKTSGTELFSACRDMTQPLVNFMKSEKAGVMFKNYNKAGIARLAKMLVPYGDGNAASLVGLDRDAIEAKLVEVEKMAKAYDLLVDPIQYVG